MPFHLLIEKSIHKKANITTYRNYLLYVLYKLMEDSL